MYISYTCHCFSFTLAAISFCIIAQCIWLYYLNYNVFSYWTPLTFILFHFIRDHKFTSVSKNCFNRCSNWTSHLLSSLELFPPQMFRYFGDIIYFLILLIHLSTIFMCPCNTVENVRLWRHYIFEASLLGKTTVVTGLGILVGKQWSLNIRYQAKSWPTSYSNLWRV